MQTFKDFNERVKREIRIESYISRYVNLKRQGKRYMGLCPFHQEKSPSFTVSPDLGFYHCFGCGKSGDVFTFVMEFEKVSFQKAREILSEYSGIPLNEYSEEDNKIAQKKQALFQLNHRALEYFQSNLFSEDGKHALKYLLDRRLTESEIKFFKLGYAPAGFQNITNLLKNKEDFSNAHELGLVKENPKRKSDYYDFFRDRVMFPIFDKVGNVVGFGGRILGESKEAKYVNSPASLVYDKGSMFFNMNHAASVIRSSKSAILVEGYLDVIGLWGKDIKNVVAPLGTGLTEVQVRNLKNYSDEVILCFDGDAAGKRAAVRAATICLKEKFVSKIILLENSLDPFDISRNKTRAELEVIFSKTIPGDNFLITEVLKGANPNSSPELKKQALESLYEFAKSLSSETDREIYLGLGAEKLGLKKSSVINDFYSDNKHFLKSIVKIDSQKVSNSQTKKVEPFLRCERSLLSMLILKNNLLQFAEDLNLLEYYEDASTILWNFIYTRYINDEPITIDSILNSDLEEDYKNFIRPGLIELNETDYTNEEATEKFQELLIRHKVFSLDDKIQKETAKSSRIIDREEMKQASDRIVQLFLEKEKCMKQLKNKKNF